MKVMLAMIVAAAMTLGVGSAFAGGACCGAKKAKEVSKDCGNCEYEKGSEECKAACEAAKKDGDAKLCACGNEKGSEACIEACSKES